MYFCCPVHRLYPFRQFPPRKLIQPVEVQLLDRGKIVGAQSALCIPVFLKHDALEVSGKSGAKPPLPSQL